jgi:gamma-glutamyltranspeptidase / glutathione hydrolase
MLDAFYQGRRRVLIKRETAMGKALPGEPPGYFPKRAGLDATIEAAGTSHLSIVDAQGNAVALTTTIENGFGSHRWAAGFLLNNQLTDFSFLPTDASGRAIANAVGPGKRPRSSMSPTFVFGPSGKLKAVLGSAGGSRIILHAVKTIVGIVDWGLDAQSAVDLPNFGSRNAGPFELETKVAGELLGAKLALFGHHVVNVDATSGLHVIIRRPDGLLEGGAAGGLRRSREQQRIVVLSTFSKFRRGRLRGHDGWIGRATRGQLQSLLSPYALFAFFTPRPLSPYCWALRGAPRA